MSNTNKPFNPHPTWREHFEFKPMFPGPAFKTVEFAPKPAAAKFIPDPIIERFSYPKDS